MVTEELGERAYCQETRERNIVPNSELQWLCCPDPSGGLKQSTDIPTHLRFFE